MFFSPLCLSCLASASLAAVADVVTRVAGECDGDGRYMHLLHRVVSFSLGFTEMTSKRSAFGACLLRWSSESPVKALRQAGDRWLVSGLPVPLIQLGRIVAVSSFPK